MKLSLSSLLYLLSCRGEPYPCIYTGRMGVLQAILGTKQELHRLSMVAFHRQSEERQGGARRGRPPPRVGRPLTTASGHHLRVVGFGVDLDHFFAPFELNW